MKMTVESNSLARISIYMAENKINSAMEAETLENMAFEANVENSDNLRGGQMARQQLQKVGGSIAYMTTDLGGLKRTHLNQIRKCGPKTP